MGLIPNPTIQSFILHMYVMFEACSLHTSRENWHKYLGKTETE